MKEGKVARSVKWPAEDYGSGSVSNFFSTNVFGQSRIAGIPTVPRKEARCPFCDSIIYSRRHKLCGVCASELPEDCLFSFIQAKSVEQTVEQERQRHRAWLRRVNQLSC
jgi:hypothetical protein